MGRSRRRSERRTLGYHGRKAGLRRRVHSRQRRPAHAGDLCGLPGRFSNQRGPANHTCRHSRRRFRLECSGLALPRGGFQGTADGQASAVFLDPDPASSLDVVAVLFQGGSTGIPPLDITQARLSVADANTASQITFAFPAPALTHSRVIVQLPTDGLLTADDVQSMSAPDFAMRRAPSPSTLPEPCPVGQGVWQPPDTSGRAAIDFMTYGAPFEPDTYRVLLASGAPAPDVQGTLNIHTFTDNATITIGAVRVLSATEPATGDVRLSVDAPTYSNPGFIAQTTVPETRGTWIGFGSGARNLDVTPPTASADSRPAVPTGLLALHGQSACFRLRPAGLRDRDASRPGPLEHDGWRTRRHRVRTAEDHNRPVTRGDGFARLAVGHRGSRDQPDWGNRLCVGYPPLTE